MKITFGDFLSQGKPFSNICSFLSRNTPPTLLSISYGHLCMNHGHPHDSNYAIITFISLHKIFLTFFKKTLDIAEKVCYSIVNQGKRHTRNKQDLVVRRKLNRTTAIRTSLCSIAKSWECSPRGRLLTLKL